MRPIWQPPSCNFHPFNNRSFRCKTRKKLTNCFGNKIKIFQCTKYIAYQFSKMNCSIFRSLADLNRRVKRSFLITCCRSTVCPFFCPSVCLYFFLHVWLCLKNQWTKVGTKHPYGKGTLNYWNKGQNSFKKWNHFETVKIGCIRSSLTYKYIVKIFKKFLFVKCF